EFTTPADANAWTLSLLIGNRYNDLHGAAAGDLPEFSAVQNGPEFQREHCLRGSGDRGPGGDRSALAACRAFILEEISAAIGDGDLAATEQVRIALRYQT